MPSPPGPLVISGPCSAESESQLLRTARELKAIPEVRIFRCGLWKPRSRPGDFEGVGEAGLPWLQKVKETTGFRLMVEVATPHHVERCLAQGVDILWIGSRTVVNPFSTREISESLRGIDIPVMVKNPVSPDLNLWIGAIERLSSAGIREISAIHRGFSSRFSHPYRNNPIWELPLELQRLQPDIPILVDPSHICGNRTLIPHICQVAMDLGFEGLMVETHHDPDNALTDREQQISPAALAKLLSGLVLKRAANGPVPELSSIRDEIDRLDEDLLNLLRKRMDAVSRISKVKMEKGLPVIDWTRWEKLLSDRLVKAGRAGLDKNFITDLFNLVHEESQRRQAQQDETDVGAG